jgi:hypothetical protein
MRHIPNKHLLHSLSIEANIRDPRLDYRSVPEIRPCVRQVFGGGFHEKHTHNGNSGKGGKVKIVYGWNVRCQGRQYDEDRSGWLASKRSRLPQGSVGCFRAAKDARHKGEQKHR